MRLTRAHVALLPDKIDDPGPMPHEAGGPPSDAYYAGQVKALLDAVPKGERIWLFAFGSLIWNKRFTYDQQRSGVVRGWHRDFCLGPDTRRRGNPAAPAYMLSLDRGGQCKGMVYRFPMEGLEDNIEGLLRKEPPFPPRWLTVATSDGPVRAFSFTHPGRNTRYVGSLSDEEIADALARAVGMLGSMAQYVQSTVEHLEQLGLCDDRLWRMQEMIAERIEKAHPEARLRPTGGRE